MSLGQHSQDNRSAGERVPGGLTSPNMPMLSSSFRSTKRQRIHRIRRQNLAPTLSTSTDSNSGKSSSAGSGNSQQNSPPNPFPMCPSCFIRDNDPRLTYIGPWTLSGTQLATSHSTTRAGSSFSLAFNGSGIIVFGTVPVSNSSDPPPEAVYHIDGQAFSTTLPFATVDVPNQPLFASSAMLNNSLHSITVNITAATSKPYIFQSILIFPNPGPGNKDAISSVPSPTSTSKTSTSSSVVASSTNGTAQAFSPGNSHTAYDPQKTIGILAGLLGTLVFIVIFAAIVFVMSRRRSLRVKQNASAEADSSSSEKGRAESTYTSFTSTESIMRHDSSIWSPFRSPRTPRSHYSRGASSHSTSGRTSTIEPPLPRIPLKSTSFVLPPHH